jgi:hypothetical protein
MLSTYEDYDYQFGEPDRLAPDADLPILRTMTDHEIAALEFGEAERETDGASDACLSAFLHLTKVGHFQFAESLT